jgi:hypothetical protein
LLDNQGLILVLVVAAYLVRVDRGFCPTEGTRYNCSFLTVITRSLSLAWIITYPGEKAIVISFNGSENNDNRLFGRNITAALTRYTKNEYIESVMSLHLYQGTAPKVQCVIDHMLAVTIGTPPSEFYQGRPQWYMLKRICVMRLLKHYT